MDRCFIYTSFGVQIVIVESPERLGRGLVAMHSSMKIEES